MPTRTRRRSEVPEEFRPNRRTAEAAKSEDFVPFTQQGFITKPQWDYICNLMDQRDLFKSPEFFDKVNAMDEGEYKRYIEQLKETMKATTRARASDVINALKALPYKQRPKREADKAPEVTDGLYALKFPEDALNPVQFFKVRHGKKDSRWDGFIFVDRFASDDLFPVKGKNRYAILKKIAGDPLAAAQRFGHEFKRCCVCSRGLTRVLSREMGIGPVCATRTGWVDEAFVENARERIIKRGDDPQATVKSGIKPLPRRGEW